MARDQDKAARDQDGARGRSRRVLSRLLAGGRCKVQRVGAATRPDIAVDAHAPGRIAFGTGLTAGLPWLGRRFSPRGAGWRANRLAIGGLAVACVMVLAAFGAYRLAIGGANADFLRDRMVAELGARLGPGAVVSVLAAKIDPDASGPRVALTDLSIAQDGGSGVSVRHAMIGVDPMALLRLKVSPREIALRDVEVKIGVAARPDTGPGTRAGDLKSAVKDMLAGLGTFVGSLTAFEGESGAPLPELKVGNLTLAFVDEAGQVSRRIAGLDATAAVARDGSVRARLDFTTRAEGAGAITVSLGAADQMPRQIEIRSDGLTLGPFLSGMEGLVEKFDSTTGVALTFTGAIDEASDVRNARLAVDIGKGRYKLADRDIPEFDSAGAWLRLSWPDLARPLVVERLEAEIEGSRVNFVGSLTPPEARDGDWLASLISESAVLAPSTAADKPLPVNGEANLRFDPRAMMLEISRFAVKAGDGTASGSLRHWLGGPNGMQLTLKAVALDIRAAMRLWPVNSAPPVRAWLLPRLTDGRLSALDLKVDFDAAGLKAAQAHEPVPDESIDLTFTIDRFTLAAIDNASPISNGVAQGRISGRKARIDLSEGLVLAGEGEGLVLRDARFQVADTARKPAEAKLTFPVSGSIDQVLAFLQQPGLREHAPVHLDAAEIDGRYEGVTEVILPMVEAPRAKEIGITVQGRLRDVTIENVYKQEKLEDGQFTLSTERDGQVIKGEAKLAGLPAAIEVRPQSGGRSEAQIRLTLDDQQRAKRGFDFSSVLSGPLPVKLTALIGGKEEAPLGVEIDLTRAKLETGIPGLSKRAGQPGKLRFVFSQTREELNAQDLKFEMGPAAIAGRLTISPAGEFKKASLGVLRISPGDNAKAEVEKAGKGFRITLRGNSFDTRPFLKGLQMGNLDNAKSVDVELDLKTTVLSGFGGELIGGADLNLIRRNGELERFELDGRFGAEPVSGRMEDAARGQRRLSFQSADAGAFLRFFDYYNKMIGGRLSLLLTLSRGGQDAELQIREFVLRNEPAVRTFASRTTSAVRREESNRAEPAQAAENADVAFTKLRAAFRRVPGRLTVREAVMWGAQVGGSIDGSIDYARDQVVLNGTFVPAYALNNIFSQVPLFGPLLGGGQYEGLFAVKFAISGKASQPVLSVNPLSAIAPGFLRKLVDFGRAVERDPDTGAPTPPAPLPGTTSER